MRDVRTPDIYFQAPVRDLILVAALDDALDQFYITYTNERVREYLEVERFGDMTKVRAWSWIDGERYDGVTNILRKLPLIIDDIEGTSEISHFYTPLKDFYLRGNDAKIN